MCVLIAAAGCKTIPADSYGVSRLRLRGMETLDSEALRACLATKERPRAKIGLGTTAEPECGVPPFDSDRVTLQLWRKLIRGWPTLDLAVLERDLKRIERWYQARGFYDAVVTGTEFNPPEAAGSDRVSDQGPNPPCRDDAEEGCEVDIAIDITEGQPVITKSISVHGDEDLSKSRRRKLQKAIVLEEGQPFDEALYDLSKAEMKFALENASFACASVSGRVDVDRDEKVADVKFIVQPNKRAVIGNVTVSGNRDLPVKTILGTAGLNRGDNYVASELADAQRAVYALGAFATVNVTGTPRVDDEDRCTGQVDVDIAVEPGKRIRWGVGAGIQAGTIEEVGQQQDVRISDIHLLGLFEHRNFLGGLRRLRIEDRPKIIFRDVYREFLQFGNEVKVEFRQPAFIEPRTLFQTNLRHDWGPDPNELFSRHDFSVSGRISRPFFDGRLRLSAGINYELYFVIADKRPDLPTDYQVFFFDERIQLDFRDDTRSPRKGFLLQVGAQQSPALLGRSWQYARVTPEARGYLPLPLTSTLAVRFGIGAMFILNSRGSLDPVSRALGPQNYRLRSGGPTSHRGFPAGFLGDDATPDFPAFDGRDPRNDGGLRRWEASIEWRVPITPNFGAALFGDFGDVNRGKTFRFDHLHTAVGIGIRYQTPVGPLRADWGILIPKAQVIGGNDDSNTFKVFKRIRGGVPGAFHVTIGEAF